MTVNTTNEGVRYIVPSEGKYLTDGNGAYSDLVYLASSANENDWYEIDENEVPKEESLDIKEEPTDVDYIEAAKILLGEKE